MGMDLGKGSDLSQSALWPPSLHRKLSRGDCWKFGRNRRGRMGRQNPSGGLYRCQRTLQANEF